jgi:hypothetical protein
VGNVDIETVGQRSALSFLKSLKPWPA